MASRVKSIEFGIVTTQFQDLPEDGPESVAVITLEDNRVFLAYIETAQVDLYDKGDPYFVKLEKVKAAKLELSLDGWV